MGKVITDEEVQKVERWLSTHQPTCINCRVGGSRDAERFAMLVDNGGVNQATALIGVSCGHCGFVSFFVPKMMGI